MRQCKNQRKRMDKWKIRAFCYGTAWFLVVVLFFWGNWLLHGGSKPGFFLNNCIAHDFFKIYCPGCGGTRAFLCLIQGNVKKALLYNPFLVYLSGIFGWYLGIEGIWLFQKIKGKRQRTKGFRLRTWMAGAGLFLFFGYCLIRNGAWMIFGIDWTGDFLVR